jgi:hypothetical protein
VEHNVGSLRTFDIHPFDLRPAVFACAALGQNPFSPPNVKGWPGGDAWITSSTLLGRKQWIDRIFRGAQPQMTAATDMKAVDMKAPDTNGNDAKGNAPEQRYRRMLDRGMTDYTFDAQHFSGTSVGHVEKLVLAMAPVNSMSGLEGAELVRALAYDPTFQLK